MSEHSTEHGHAHDWETSTWPPFLAIGILFLVPLTFSFFYVYDSIKWSVVCACIGLVLTVVPIAGWVSEAFEDKYGWGQGHSVPAMPFFIVAEAFIFVSFFVAYWALRLLAPEWPPPGTPEIDTTIPIIMTFVLVASSFTIHFSESALDKDDHGGYKMWLVVTMILGLVFMGLSASEWKHLLHEGFTVATNFKGTAFYTITGFHASHVFVGLSMFLCLLIPALKGKTNKPLLHSASIYWHFVDIIWFFVVSQIYFW